MNTQLEASQKALAQAEAVLQTKCEECERLRSALPAGDYVLVADMCDGNHAEFGGGLFCTQDAVRSVPKAQEGQSK